MKVWRNLYGAETLTHQGIWIRDRLMRVVDINQYAARSIYGQLSQSVLFYKQTWILNERNSNRWEKLFAFLPTDIQKMTFCQTFQQFLFFLIKLYNISV